MTAAAARPCLHVQHSAALQCPRIKCAINAVATFHGLRCDRVSARAWCPTLAAETAQCRFVTAGGVVAKRCVFLLKGDEVGMAGAFSRHDGVNRQPAAEGTAQLA